MKRFFRVVVVLLGVFFILATLLPLLRSDAWWVRIFDYPRAQIAAAGLAVAAVFTVIWKPARLWETLLVVALLGCVGYQLVRMSPYMAMAPEQVLDAERASPDSTISVLVANVLMDNREAEPFEDVVAHFDPDLVLVLEPDAWWEDRLRTLEAEYPHTLKAPRDNTYGMLLYSRLSLHRPEILHMVEDTIPSMHAQVELPAGLRVWFHALHPNPPNPRYADDTTERDAELLIVGRQVKERGAPAIVAGDFNDVTWSRTTRLFQEVSGLLDPRRGRNFYSTYNAKRWGMRWPLDHVFHSNEFKLVRLERGPAFGSDHFPLFVELAVDPDAEWQQEEPRAEPEDEQEAEEKIKRGTTQEDG